MSENVFKFKLDYKKSTVIPEHLGRLELASGHIVRIIFDANGMKLIVPKDCIEKGDIILVDLPKGIGYISDL